MVRIMQQTEKYQLALSLLKELNCPEEIMDALFVFGIFVHNDETKLHNWEALSGGGLVEGESRELPPEEGEKKEIECLPKNTLK